MNNKILDIKTSLFYLIYVKSNSDKYVSVIKTLSSEIINTTHSPKSNNFKSGDLKDLQRKVP